MLKRGRPKTLDEAQIERDILKFLSPYKTADMKLGYPTSTIHEYLTKWYRKKYSRRTILRRLKSLHERHMIECKFKHRRYYWKAQILPFKVDDKWATGKQIRVWREEFKKIGLDRDDIERFYKMMSDEIPFPTRDILRISPEVLLSLKQEWERKKEERERKERNGD